MKNKLLYRSNFAVGPVGLGGYEYSDERPCCLAGWVGWIYWDNPPLSAFGRMHATISRVLDREVYNIEKANDHLMNAEQRQLALELWLKGEGYEIVEVV